MMGRESEPEEGGSAGWKAKESSKVPEGKGK